MLGAHRMETDDAHDGAGGDCACRETAITDSQPIKFYGTGNDFFCHETETQDSLDPYRLETGRHVARYRCRYTPKYEKIIKKFLKDGVTLLSELELEEECDPPSCIVKLPQDLLNYGPGTRYILLIRQDSGIFNAIHVYEDFPNVTQHKFFVEEAWEHENLREGSIESLPGVRYNFIKQAIKWEPSD
jgi:hypothetical protein